MEDSRNKRSKNWSIFFNNKRTFRSYLYLLKFYLFNTIKYVPNRITAARRKLPDFIIIGAAKGGTTSLYHYLNQHPGIQMSREKEIHYFAKYYKRGIKYYQSFFPLKNDSRITGEASPYYLYHPHAAARIKKDVPSAKIIVLLRDPVIRAYSHYNMLKGVDWVESFQEAVEVEKDRVDVHHKKMMNDHTYNNQHHQTFSYMCRGLYHGQLEKWLEHYSLDQLLIIKSEDFFEDPRSALSEVYEYIGIDKIYPDDLKPRNARKYEELSKEEISKYREYFREDGEKLKNLLGPKFVWNE